MNPLALLLGAGQTNALGFPVAAPGTGFRFDLPPAGPPAPGPSAQAPQGPSKLRNFLGALGDALSVGNGGEPYYRQRMQEQQVRGTLQGFLANPDDAIAALMKVDPVSAIGLYKAVHPASETPDTAKIYEYRQGLDPSQRPEFDKVIQTLHPGLVAPIQLEPGDTYSPGGGAEADVTATGPNGEKIRLNRQSNQWEPVGGAMASPSPTFPGRR